MLGAVNKFSELEAVIPKGKPDIFAINEKNSEF